jgi:hypothetical protein
LTKQSGCDRNKLRDLLMGAGNYKQGMALNKTLADQRQAEALAKKTQLEHTIKLTGFAGQMLATSRDQPSYDQARAQMRANGIDISHLPPQFDPRQVSDLIQQGMSIKEQREQEWKAMEYTTPNANARLSAQTSTANNERSVAASRDNAAATRAVAGATRDSARISADATREAARMKGDRDAEMKLADDYRAQSKNFKETADAYKQISAVLDKSTTSAAATLAGATKFMKMIDPGSVVRESELGMALAATGVFDRATNYYNTLKNGKVLTPSQAADFKNITKQINDAASQQQKLVDKHFAGVARGYKLRPEMVVQDFGQNDAPTSNIDALLDKYK